MKKILLLLLLMGVLAACGSDDDSPQSEEKSTPAQVTLVPNASSSNTTAAAQNLNVGQGELVLNVTMPEGYKFNNAAPFTLALTSSSPNVNFEEGWQNYQNTQPEMPLAIPLTLQQGASLLTMDLTVYWCEAIKETLCFVEKQTLTIPVTVTADAGNSIANVDLALVPPEIDN